MTLSHRTVTALRARSGEAPEPVTGLRRRRGSRSGGRQPDDVYGAVVDWAAEQGLELYPHQDEAVLELLGGRNVVLATPDRLRASRWSRWPRTPPRWPATGSPSTPRRSRRWSARSSSPCARSSAPTTSGMLTGDASVNADAPVICCTAEMLANIALREGRRRRRRAGGDGRVPLLRRAGPRLGLAGAAAGAAAGAVPADVGHARRRHRARRRPDPAHRPGDRGRRPTPSGRCR